MADKSKEIAASLTAYEPSLRERIGNATYDVAKALGLPYANRMRGDIENVVDFIPGVGDAVGVSDALGSFQSGDYTGAGLAAAGLIPGVGDVASKALKALPSSASLNIPAAPTLEQLLQMAKMQPVPLDMARGSQPRMNWDDFNSGNYAAPMFEGFEDAPVAAMRRDGEYIVFDGHHRTVNAMNQGQTELPMYVIPAEMYDPANAGIAQSPAKWSAQDDELLRELGL